MPAGFKAAADCGRIPIDFQIMILARQREEVVYVIRRRTITQSKSFIWKTMQLKLFILLFDNA